MKNIYKETYFLLFNAITYALELLDKNETLKVSEYLKLKQLETEQVFIDNKID